MPLHSYSVGSYRSFVSPVEIELRPLTLFFGFNNVGKSALARFIPLVSHSVGQPRGLPLYLPSAAVRGGSFSDLRSHLTGSLQVEFRLEWEPDNFGLHYVVADLPEKRRQVVLSFEISKGSAAQFVAEWQEDVAGESKYSVRIGSGEIVGATIDWNGLIPRARTTLPANALSLLDGALAALLELKSTLWIGAIRRTPRRFAELPVAPPSDPAFDGTGAGDILAWDALQGGPVLPRVSAWYEKNTGTAISVDRPGETYSILVGRHKVNIADAGEGMTQVLPVLVDGALASARAEDEPIVLVCEQPELHLHPGVHAPLAEYFCEIARADQAPRMIIETHSENFLFGVQLAIARGELDPNRAIVYWLRQESGETDVTRVEFDHLGRPDKWPREVFAEDTRLAALLLAERRKRGYK